MTGSPFEPRVGETTLSHPKEEELSVARRQYVPDRQFPLDTIPDYRNLNELEHLVWNDGPNDEKSLPDQDKPDARAFVSSRSTDRSTDQTWDQHTLDSAAEASDSHTVNAVTHQSGSNEYYRDGQYREAIPRRLSRDGFF